MTRTYEEYLAYEKKLQYGRDYRKEHKEEINKKQRDNYAENSEEILAKHRKGTPRGIRKWWNDPWVVEFLSNIMDAKLSVSYETSPRWNYYRVIGKTILGKVFEKNKEGLTKFKWYTEKAREREWTDPKGRKWTPRTFKDSVRQPYFVGHGHETITINLNTIEEQDNYVQCWFEAQAMFEQFLKWTNDYRVSLVPFRGDCSIDVKGELAEYLDQIHEDYPDKPIKILYFGDCDAKGSIIPYSALRNKDGYGISTWCKSWDYVDFIPCGLTLGQAKAFNLEENPEKPNTFQWESLSDAQAGAIILEALKKVMKPVSQSILDREAELEKELKEYYDLL